MPVGSDSARVNEHGFFDLLALPTQPLIERTSALRALGGRRPVGALEPGAERGGVAGGTVGAVQVQANQSQHRGDASANASRFVVALFRPQRGGLCALVAYGSAGAI